MGHIFGQNSLAGLAGKSNSSFKATSLNGTEIFPGKPAGMPTWLGCVSYRREIGYFFWRPLITWGPIAFHCLAYQVPGQVGRPP
jgi:hypothetical protein